MKRLFLILCLMMICNISYADIASVGYVDSVVAGKQDSIIDIETIRTGAGLGATAVQPSSLSTVATSGSYNDLSNKPTIPTVPTTISSFTNDSGYITTSYHDSTKQDKLPNVPGNNGKYKLVWNNNTGQLGWELEQFSLTCSSGTYDIGFSQCIDPHINADSYTNDSSTMTWSTTFSYGIIKGIASCNSTPGTYAQTTNVNFSQTDKGRYCWCKMTSPATSSWVFHYDRDDVNDCAIGCAFTCGNNTRALTDYRSKFFSSVGQ